eukprot:1312050-Pyramimonas_sp.AAC.1
MGGPKRFLTRLPLAPEPRYDQLRGFSSHKPRRDPGRCGDAGTEEGKPESWTVASRGEVGSR